MIMSSDSDDDAAQVFDVAEKEREIIDYDGSLFVIGRSGSGMSFSLYPQAVLTIDSQARRPASLFVSSE